jgi:DNA-binding MarR family transcriptional regulator
MDRTSLYRAMAPMLRGGWLGLSAGVDARSHSATINRKGNEVLRKADAGWDQMQDRLLKGFGKSEWTALVGELNRLAQCFEVE